MEITMQSSIMLVGDLDCSIAFYTGVLDFTLISRRAQAAALLIDEADRTQVLTLREAPHRPMHPGRGSIGVRVLGFEVASIEELDLVHKRLDERHAFVGRRRADSWELIIGVDPDQCEFTVATGTAGHPIRLAHWHDLDDMIEAIAQ